MSPVKPPKPSTLDAASGASQSTAPSTAKEKLRRGFAVGLHATGALRLLRRFEGTRQIYISSGSRWPRIRRFSGSKFGILCYHRVGMDGVPLFSRLDPGVFAAQMRYVRKHYRLVSLGQLCRELANNDSVPPTLAITFDDGYRDLYAHAFPVLRNYRIPATIYLIGRCMETGESPWYDRIFVALDHAPGDSVALHLDKPCSLPLTSVAQRRQAAWQIVCFLRSVPDATRRAWCTDFEARMNLPQDRLANRMLDWDQVRAMQKAGVHFGAHTMTHPSVGQVEQERLDEELNSSRKLLEAHLNAPVEDFAYPFGKTSDCLSPSDPSLARYGYQSAVTTISGINSAGADMFRLNRMQIGDDPSLSVFAFELARMFFEGTVENAARPAATASDLHALEADRRAS